MKRNKITAISAVIIGTSIIGLTLGGCHGTSGLDKSVVIAEDVKGDVVSSALKIIDKKEYVVEENKYFGDDIFLRKDGNLYTFSATKEAVMEIDNVNEKYVIQKINFQGDKATREEVEKSNIYAEKFIESSKSIYNWEVLSDKELRLYDPFMQNEVIVDYEKLKATEFYNKDNEQTYILKDNLLMELVILPEFYKFTQVNWCNLDDYSTGSVNIPKEFNIQNFFGDVVEDKMYFVTENSSSNAIGRIDLNSGKVEQPVEIKEKIMGAEVLDENTVLMVTSEGIKGEDAKLMTLDMKNKIVKEVATLKEYKGLFYVSSNKDKLFYDRVVDGKTYVMAMTINNGSIEGECEIYQYEESDEKKEIYILEENNGKDIIMGVIRNKYITENNESYRSNVLESVVKVKFNR